MLSPLAEPAGRAQRLDVAVGLLHRGRVALVEGPGLDLVHYVEVLGHVGDVGRDGSGSSPVASGRAAPARRGWSSRRSSSRVRNAVADPDLLHDEYRADRSGAIAMMRNRSLGRRHRIRPHRIRPGPRRPTALRLRFLLLSAPAKCASFNACQNNRKTIRRGTG
jgi:hypothetical protein